MPEMLSVLPLVMEEIFGINSILMETTPREFLFEGVGFCKNQDDISKLVCGLIAENAPATIKLRDDGSLSFSLYGHVSSIDQSMLLYVYDL